MEKAQLIFQRCFIFKWNVSFYLKKYAKKLVCFWQLRLYLLVVKNYSKSSKVNERNPDCLQKLINLCLAHMNNSSLKEWSKSVATFRDILHTNTESYENYNRLGGDDIVSVTAAMSDGFQRRSSICSDTAADVMRAPSLQQHATWYVRPSRLDNWNEHVTPQIRQYSSTPAVCPRCPSSL